MKLRPQDLFKISFSHDICALGKNNSVVLVEASSHTEALNIGEEILKLSPYSNLKIISVSTTDMYFVRQVGL